MYEIAQDQCHVLLQGRQISGVLTGKKSVVSKQIDIVFCFVNVKRQSIYVFEMKSLANHYHNFGGK